MNEPAVNWDELLMLRELQPLDEPDIVDELIGHFLHDGSERLMRLKQAAATGDFQALIREAHTLRGSAGLLGARRLLLDSEELELFARSQPSGAQLGALVDRVSESFIAARYALTQRPDVSASGGHPVSAAHT